MFGGKKCSVKNFVEKIHIRMYTGSHRTVTTDWEILKIPGNEPEALDVFQYCQATLSRYSFG
jgi:hypothetical protein